MTERRNHTARADVLSRVVTWLRQQTDPAATFPADVADTLVALRIVKRLAVRGLARHVPGGWVPTAVLRTPAPLTLTDAPI